MQRLRAIASGLGALDADGAPEPQPAAATAEEPTTQPTQLLSPEEIRSFKENGFVVAKGLVSRAMTDAVLDYAWANTPPEVDRHDPQSWIDPKNRWQAEGGSLAGGIDVQRDETGKRPGIFSPMNNWKFHAAFFSDEGQRLMTLWNEGPVQAVVKQLIGGPVRQLHHAKGIYFQFPTREVDTVGDKAAGTLMPSRKVRTRGLHRDTQPFQICSAVYLDDVPSGGGGFTCLPGSHAELYPTFEHEYHYEPIQPLHDETMKRLIKTIEPHEVTGGRGDTLFYHHR